MTETEKVLYSHKTTERKNAMYPDRIDTERLVVRRVREDDWQDIRDIWMDFSASRYACYDTPKETEPAAVRDTVSRWAECAYGDDHLFYAVCLQDRVIGFFALNRAANTEDPRGYYLGYTFHSGFFGKGYASESFRAITDMFISAGKRVIIVAGTAENNIPSVRFLRNAGFDLAYTDLQSFYKDEKGEPILFSSLWFVKRL
jgi:RimJ/RimL family protein N-acetyltransferase